MKILSIGDIHGEDSWMKFGDIKLLYDNPGVYTPDFDYYIFVGDYVDSFTILNSQIILNLKEIILFKKLYPDNVILLLGNHDLYYMLDHPNSNEKKHACSGNRQEIHFDLYELFNKNKDIFLASFQIENYIWTHAGIHIGWYNNFKKELNDLIEGFNIDTYDNADDMDIADQLNLAFEYKLECLFDVGHLRGGSKNVGGPFWLDKNLSHKKPLKDYHQIVGHTPINNIQTYNINNDTSITYIDILWNKDSSYVIKT